MASVLGAARMSRPTRIQLSRRKGARKPAGAVVVARPSIWGNPFRVSEAIEAGYPPASVVSAFEDWLTGDPWACGIDRYESRRAVILDRIGELRGKDLACWCPLDQPCHADVLLRLANAEDQP